jgi:hypothetical protein
MSETTGASPSEPRSGARGQKLETEDASMKGSFGWKAGLLLPLVVLAACGARRPVVYDNEKAREVGQAEVDRAIDECMERAKQFKESGGTVDAGSLAEGTARGAAVGAAAGAAGGAIGGNAGRGAATGAAAGGAAGFMDRLFGGLTSREPDPVYANYVNRCLREKGYEPIGWR